MRSAIRREYGTRRPRAIVLDDNANARKMTAIQLRRRGFDVTTCDGPAAFQAAWSPGTVDVIVADWELTGNRLQNGDRILADVRARDWDVPFVLVSGKLAEDSERVEVLGNLLERGSARFVTRGADGIRKACDAAQDLIERRDAVVLRVVLSLRDGALSGGTIQTSSGVRSVKELLEEIVSEPRISHDAGRPVASSRSRRIIGANA